MPQCGADYRIRVTSFNALTLPSAQPFSYTLQASVGAGQQITLIPRDQISLDSPTHLSYSAARYNLNCSTIKQLGNPIPSSRFVQGFLISLLGG